MFHHYSAKNVGFRVQRPQMAQPRGAPEVSGYSVRFGQNLYSACSFVAAPTPAPWRGTENQLPSASPQWTGLSVRPQLSIAPGHLDSGDGQTPDTKKSYQWTSPGRPQPAGDKIL